MQIIPVIDIKNGIPVHAIAGKRDDYGPIKNSRFDARSVFHLCEQIVNEFSPICFYAADLDAIENGNLNASVLDELLGLPTHWLLDVGLKTAAELRAMQERFASSQNWSAVFGSETVSSFEELELAANQFDDSRIVFSCDLRNGQLIGNESISRRPLGSLMAQIATLGIRRFILIDLADVGTDHASLPDLIREANLELASIQLFAGGGVKDQSDIRRFEASGCSGVLVATAIHHGKITGMNARNEKREN